MINAQGLRNISTVMPRKRHVSRNPEMQAAIASIDVMPRKRHVSRNDAPAKDTPALIVMPRKRHVSRNNSQFLCFHHGAGHASQEACE